MGWAPPESLAAADDNAVSAVMGECDLMSRKAMSDGPDNEKGSSESGKAKECASCFDKLHYSVFTGACGHEFCLDCSR
ncbi:hypothetical protein N7466_003887 [Penicillium verhagenii]|uniref:uncharacterized protein n=1 Tax=Penicillium verhagenii TaxID=1562060 RepID=UPI002545411D|nr:uncharacterized protein N7466_003887 [Penicillium verhagenii]KAJ5934340.1 hypothetical protein N7466_003887 [Penicillium verhagenii]